MGTEARADLAAMVAPLARALIAAERPVLREHGLTMWGYTVLVGLGGQPVRTQNALAQAIGADKTRIIGVLDDLEQRALIRRQPDPADRRVRLLSLTARGRRLRASVQAEIQRGEERWLRHLSPADRKGFLHSLAVLAALPPDDTEEG